MSSEQRYSVSTSSEEQTSNIGQMDSSGTTYYSPPPFFTNTLNDINLYLPNSTKNNNEVVNIFTNENVDNWINDISSVYECPDTVVNKLNYIYFFYVFIYIYKQYFKYKVKILLSTYN